MKRVRGRGHNTANEDTAALGNRTGEGDCPAIVVGIGAPPGGMRSLKQLFSAISPGHRTAFVLIQHSEPSSENLIIRELRDQAALEVVEAKDGMPVLADRIHVMPPGKFLSIEGCILTLHEPVDCNGLRMPIDHFFCSLATDQKRRGCGILLAGTGSDGTLGLSEIKATGGRSIAEAPESAEPPQMRQPAIDAGVVDAVLPAEAMAGAILALAEQVMTETRGEPTESPEFDANLRSILDILRAGAGHDFRCYKPNTLVRRIRRRMTLAKIETFADYARFLNEHPEEVSLLQKDLLIGVTEFFRQPPAWETLKRKVVAPLVENAERGSEIRVWIPGCSTGQEAYSLAMLLSEQIEESGKELDVQIFATDSDAAALATARSGSYSEEELGPNVSPARRTRFFTVRDGHYQIIKQVRDRIVFAPQNLMTDPPFSRLDLISCRNLLIYLHQQVQQKIVALFHFALTEGGFLFLGTAETVGERVDLFEPISKKWRIYRRIGVGRRVSIEIPVRPTHQVPFAPGKQPSAASANRLSLASAAQQMLLERFAPACVMIDRKLQVLYVHGAVENYLTFPPGELTTRVVDMAREGLRARLHGAISKCIEANRPVSITARVRRGQKSVPVKATVSSLKTSREANGLLLVTFEDYRGPIAKSLREEPSEGSDIRQLEDELKVMQEELQSTIEQLEISNEQLKAANEEVTAANEELQSANEELETSKEELQSLNEELNMSNIRLQEKVDELEIATNDLVNLLSSTHIATVFLDKDLAVKRYTPAITQLLSLIPSDVGRPFGDILRRFSDETLGDDARRVLADLTPLSKEVRADDARWYIRRITPYRTHDDRIEGVVVIFVDVSDLKRTEKALRELGEDLNRAQAVAHIGSWRLDVRHNELTWSDETHRLFGIPKGTPLTYEAFLGIVHPDDRQYVDEKWRAALQGEPYDIEHRIVVGGVLKWVRERAELELDSHGVLLGGFGTVQDITERKHMEKALRKSRNELEERVRKRTVELMAMNETLKIHATMLEQRNRDLDDFAHVASHDLQEPLRKIQTFADRLIKMHQMSLDDRARDYLERMQRAAGRMQALVLDLVRYSRAASKPETFALLNLSEPVEEAVMDLDMLRDEVEGEIDVDELPDVEADQVQMRQLFQNLIANGLKYRGEQKPVIRICNVSSSSDPFCEIHIKDNGIGFDEAYLDRIFKPFQRLHGRSAPYQGTGMGLAICRRIVEHHGGSITARSKPGEGATFIVRLPRKQTILERTQ